MVVSKELLVESLEKELQELLKFSLNPFIDVPEDHCYTCFEQLSSSEKVQLKFYILEKYGYNIKPYDEIRKILW
jgi:hypothetical protein